MAEDRDEPEPMEFWGYLFKSDRTGTRKLKNLLRGLYGIIGREFEPSDSTDITPSQLAQYYRSLNGNYDTLFLSTPPATIAFIYKNLGCLHSLQPLPATRENKFSDPIIPALKVEGFIMWQTIQLLLGPDEHAGFLREAVQRWDVPDPDSGKPFPKVLPRECFPQAPDAHMVAWYEGVSERLRREAEEEQSMRITGEEPRRQIEAAERRRREREHDTSTDDESTDSRRTALAYFRNPLYRTGDGKPSVVRRRSRHRNSDPRDTSLLARGKQAATSVGNVVRSIGSPHLWDGYNKDKEREKELERRRRSLPHNHHMSDRDDEERMSPHLHARVNSGRRGSAQPSPASDREFWTEDGRSPRRTPNDRVAPRRTDSDHTVRHSRSHEPSPSPREYFPPYESYDGRRNSGHAAQSPISPPRNDGVPQTGFLPSASPLFATTVARSDRTYRPSQMSPRAPDSPLRQTRDNRRDDRQSRPKATRFDTPMGNDRSPLKERR